MLRALVCSDTALAAELARSTRSDVYLCRDRHSDFICWLTCSLAPRKALHEAGHVAVTLVPEQYINWHPCAKAHEAVMRITSVAPNARGELLLIDSEMHVIYMASRHIPCKLTLIAGKLRTAGPAVHGSVSGKAVRLREPQFLAMLTITPGKEEYCYFSDVGNGAIRLIANVHSSEAKPSVTTCEVRSIAPLEPYALALVSTSASLVLAVAEDRRRRVLLVSMDPGQRTRGAVMRGMEWGGLLAVNALASLDPMLYIANGTNVLAVDLSHNSAATGPAPATALAAPPGEGWQLRTFVDAQGLAVEPASGGVPHSGFLFVADAGANQIRKLAVDGTVVQHVQLFGSGVGATLPGPCRCTPAAYSDSNLGPVAFHEPLGLAVQHGVLFVACYGGELHGAVVAVSPTQFAIQLLRELSALYDAFGFMPPGASAARRTQRHPPLEASLDAFAHCMDFLDSVCLARSQHLDGHRGLKGPDGSFYWHTVKGGQITLESCRTIQRQLEAMGVTNAESMTLYAMVDEGPVEHGFGQWVMQSQTDAPTVKMFAEALPQIQRHTIMSLGSTSWSHHTGVRTHYAPAQTSSVSATAMMAVAERAFRVQHPEHQRSVQPGSEADKERLSQEKRRVKRFTRIAEAQRVGTVRAFYKGRVGFGPTVLLPSIVPDDAGTALRRFPSYRERLRVLLERTGVSSAASAELLTHETCSLLSGEIVFLLAGTEDDFWRRTDEEEEYVATMEGALWWPVQLNRSVKKTQSGENCRLHSFWMDKLPRSECDATEAEAEGERWALLSGTEVTPTPRICNLLKDPTTGCPFVVASEDLPSEWSTTEGQVYRFSTDWLDKLNGAAETALGAVDLESDAEGDSGTGDKSDGSKSDDEDKEAERTAAARKRDALRQTSLCEAMANHSAIRRPVSREQQLVRFEEIRRCLSSFRAEFLAATGAEEISSGDWPPSLRRLLKESQELSRALEGEGFTKQIQLLDGPDSASPSAAASLEQRIISCIAQYLATKPSVEAIDAVTRTELRNAVERELELPCNQQDEHFTKPWFKEVTLRLRTEAIARVVAAEAAPAQAAEAEAAAREAAETLTVVAASPARASAGAGGASSAGAGGAGRRVRPRMGDAAMAGATAEVATNILVNIKLHSGETAQVSIAPEATNAALASAIEVKLGRQVTKLCFKGGHMLSAPFSRSTCAAYGVRNGSVVHVAAPKPLQGL